MHEVVIQIIQPGSMNELRTDEEMWVADIPNDLNIEFLSVVNKLEKYHNISTWYMY